MNPYFSLISLRIPRKIRDEAARNYLESGGSNLLQSWPAAGLPALPRNLTARIRSPRRTGRR